MQTHGSRPEAAPAIAPYGLSTPEDRLLAADWPRVTPRICMRPALARFKPEE